VLPVLSLRRKAGARYGERRGEASNERIHMDRLSLSPHGCAINAVRGNQSMTEFAREAIAREIQRRLTEAATLLQRCDVGGEGVGKIRWARAIENCGKNQIASAPRGQFTADARGAAQANGRPLIHFADLNRHQDSKFILSMCNFHGRL